MNTDDLVHEAVGVIGEAEFTDAVLKSAVPVLVDFSAKWCGPCRMLEPVVNQLAIEFAGEAKVVKVDIDESPGLATSYAVTAVPTLLIFKDGEVVDNAIGLSPGAALKDKLRTVVDGGQGFTS